MGPIAAATGADWCIVHAHNEAGRLRMTDETLAGDWRSRVIAGRGLGVGELPSWAERSYQALRVEVTDDAYPCFFGVQAEKRGEMFYAFVSKDESDSLVPVMATFAELAKQPVHEKNNLAVFFEPDATPLSHQEYHDLFWRTLQSLHDADDHPHAGDQVDPADPAWEFSYGGVEMFVVCGCPSFTQRHSRNLGPGMVLLFQPRSVFIDKITNKVIGRRAREEVRKRLKMWDDVGAHPDLGFYGDPGNLEWKQYFLPDDNRAATGVCPFASRRSKAANRSSVLPERTQASEYPAQSLGVIECSSAEAGNFPLTPAQEALWFLWRMEPQSAAYHVSAAVEIEGVLDVDALRAALLCIVERHAILRTGFLDIGGVALQCIDADATRAIDFEEHDVRQTEPMSRAYELLQERGNRSFDLGGDGLLRLTLLRLADCRSIVQLCTHQIVVDPWSLQQLQYELLECYAALCDGRSPKRTAVSMEAKAFIDAPTMARHLAYWRERLGDVDDAIELPLDRPRPPRRQTVAGRVSDAIAADVHASVQRLSAERDTAPAVVMLSAFALLLQRYSGQTDVRIAVPLRQEPKSCIGQFSN
ncbi:MAG: YqcI/YcgG family protein, partial [Steroidobacteraceae bacterium]